MTKASGWVAVALVLGLAGAGFAQEEVVLGAEGSTGGAAVGSDEVAVYEEGASDAGVVGGVDPAFVAEVADESLATLMQAEVPAESPDEGPLGPEASGGPAAEGTVYAAAPSGPEGGGELTSEEIAGFLGQGPSDAAPVVGLEAGTQLAALPPGVQGLVDAIEPFTKFAEHTREEQEARETAAGNAKGMAERGLKGLSDTYHSIRLRTQKADDTPARDAKWMDPDQYQATHGQNQQERDRGAAKLAARERIKNAEADLATLGGQGELEYKVYQAELLKARMDLAVLRRDEAALDALIAEYKPLMIDLIPNLPARRRGR